MQGRTADSRTRILDAAIRTLVREGLAGATMGAIAREARSSKALVHYHFADRAALFAEAAQVIGVRLLDRERGVFHASEAASSVDALWRWLEVELARGELRALLALRGVHEDGVRESIRDVERQRLDSAESTISALFGRLGLTPRVPPEMIAGASLVFVDGLAHGDEPSRDARTSFDVFWLAMLSLGS